MKPCTRANGCTLADGHPGVCLPFSAATTLVPAARARVCDDVHGGAPCGRECWQLQPESPRVDSDESFAPAESAAVLTGEVGPTRVPVDIPSGAEGLVVGPEDVLVIAFAIDLTPSEMRALRAQMEERLPGSRFVIVAGYNAHIGVVKNSYKSDRGVIEDGVLRPPLPPA